MRYRLIDLYHQADFTYIDNMEVDEYSYEVVDDPRKMFWTDIGDTTYELDATQVVELDEMGECIVVDSEGDRYGVKFTLSRPLTAADMLAAGIQHLAPCQDRVTVYEVVGAGFDGGTDEAGYRVLWVEVQPGAEGVLVELAKAHGVVGIGELKMKVEPHPTDIDYRFPHDLVALLTRLDAMRKGV